MSERSERFPTPTNKEDKEGTEQTLRWISDKILNEKGRSDVDGLIRDDKLESAKEYLLGVTDGFFEAGKLNFEQAAELYTLIGVSPERASELRQKRAKQ